MRDEIENVLKEIREILRADGGDIELVQVTEDGIVQVRFIGVCGTCGGAMNTLRRGVERMLKEQIPGIKEVVAI